VHRVVRVVVGGVITRGDASRRGDDGVVALGRVLGRVVSAHLGGRTFAVAGGLLGRVHRAVAPIGVGVVRAVVGLVLPLRGFLPPAGWAATLLPARTQPRVVRFESAGRVERLVLVGGRVAGRFDEAGAAWHIRLRFRPFIRSQRLPRR
jgi:hypothetical protein